jgi:hypothetical protein
MSEPSGNIVTALITGGLGTALGGIVIAIVQVISGKGESRAAATDRITNAAGNLTDRLDAMNTRLEAENRTLREAVLLLTDVLDEVLPQIHGSADAVTKLRAARRAARRMVV